MEPRTEKECIARACESAGARQLSAENTLQVKTADLQASPLHHAPYEEREGCHQQVFSGQEIIGNGKKSNNDISPSPLWDMDFIPDKQESLCAVLSSAKLCDEPGEGEQSSELVIHDSCDPDILCSRWANETVSKANPKSVLECGEPECKGDADISAVHDKLWKLLHEDDSDYRIPFESRGIPSLGTRLPDIKVTELNFAQETCSYHPLSTQESNPMSTERNGSTVAWEGKLAVNNAAETCADSPQSGPKANPVDISDMSHGTVHTELSMINESVPGEGCHFKDCYPTGGELASFPEEKDIFPSENTSQFTHEVNLQGKGNRSGLNAPNDTNSDSSHLSKANGCQDFQIVSNAQKYSSVMQIQIHESITHKNLPQNTDQVTEIAKQKGAGREDGGSRDQLHSHPLLGNKTLPFPTYPEVLPSESACPDTRSEGKTGSVQTGVQVNGNLTTLETSCELWQGLFQRVPGESKGEAALCENEHETKAPLHTLTGSQALKQIMNISTEQSCPDLIPSSKITEADNSIKSTEYDKKEEVNFINLVNLPPADSGNNQCFQEQPPRRRTQSFSLTWTTLDSFPVNTESERNQEGSKSCQTPLAAAEPEPMKRKEDTTKSGHVAAGAKKKLPPATLSKKPRLEERGSVSQDPSCVKKAGKSEGGVIHKEQRKLILKKDSKGKRKLILHLLNVKTLECSVSEKS